MDSRVRDAVRERSCEERLSCASALALAEELGVAPLEVGEAANELDIKIVACQLGCFGQRRTEGQAE